MTSIHCEINPQPPQASNAVELTASPFEKGGSRGISSSCCERSVSKIPPSPPFAKGGTETFVLNSTALPQASGDLSLQGSKKWPAAREYPVERWRGDERQNLNDAIIEEAPVALFYNNQPHVVMLATPLDLADFALGFSVTEGIIEYPAELVFVEEYHREEGIELWLRIPPERFATLSSKERNLTGRTGCGLCGAATLSQAVRRPAPVGEGVRVSVVALRQALHTLPDLQRLNQFTGAVHCAAWASSSGEILLVREDVGRHNALDKLIGALLASQTDLTQGFVIVTSRASFEMVQKCAAVGISFMAAISAPTGLAIRLAQETGLTLLGFARGERHTVYAHPQRLVGFESAIHGVQI
jgi:FdhD protein